MSDVDYIRKINTRGSTYSRSDWYKGGRFVPNEDTLLSMTDDSEHKALRMKMAPGVRKFFPNLIDFLKAYVLTLIIVQYKHREQPRGR